MPSLSTKVLLSSIPAPPSESRPAYFKVDGCSDPYLILIMNGTAYFAEWLEPYLIVDVDKFWIVDDDSADNQADPIAS
jgi:hypothetical protein